MNAKPSPTSWAWRADNSRHRRTLCSAGKRPMAGTGAGNWNGWSPADDNARYVPGDKAGLSIGQLSKLKLKWAFGFPGDIIAFGAPTVFNGTVFTGSASGKIYALDAQTGCTHWTFEANGPVRSAILVVRNGPRTVLIFSDQIGWAYSLDAATGRQIWRKSVAVHEATRLTGSPVEHDGVVYIPAASWEESRSVDAQYPCCTFRGNVTALRVSDGSMAWRSFMVDPPMKTGVTKMGTATYGPSGAGIWSAADHRRQARRVVCNHRRQLFASRHENQRRHRGPPNQDRKNPVGPADTPRRRLQFRMRRQEPPRIVPTIPAPTTTSVRQRCWSAPRKEKKCW